ncbi:hypothetical protein H2248_002350 [Termitomyces sp. 'cryptogamus']|nr:hypothetical protein H2248_002350 [Termitomyces sp. 'cryptogamus']
MVANVVGLALSTFPTLLRIQRHYRNHEKCLFDGNFGPEDVIPPTTPAQAPWPHKSHTRIVSKYTLDEYSTSVMVQTYKVLLVHHRRWNSWVRPPHSPYSSRSLAPPPQKMRLRHPIMETATTTIIHGWATQYRRW